MLLTLKEAGELLGVHWMTIRKWTIEDNLPFIMAKNTDFVKSKKRHLKMIDEKVLLEWYNKHLEKTRKNMKNRGDKKRELTEKQKEYIRRYSNKKTMKQIAGELGITWYYVSRLIREEGLPRKIAEKGKAIRNPDGKYRKRRDRYYSIPPLIDDNKFYQNWSMLRLLYEMYFKKQKKEIENVY